MIPVIARPTIFVVAAFVGHAVDEPLAKGVLFCGVVVVGVVVVVVRLVRAALLLEMAVVVRRVVVVGLVVLQVHWR